LNFGPHQSAYQTTVTVGGLPASANLSREHESILVSVPPGAGGQALVRVTVDGLSSTVNPAHCISYARPHVLACTKSGASGGHFVVSGQHFGTGVNANIAIWIGGKQCTRISVLNPHSKLEAIIPEGSGANRPIRVQIAGVDASLDASCTFSYQGSVPRTKAAIPDSSEVVNIFCQAQLSRYFKNGIR